MQIPERPEPPKPSAEARFSDGLSRAKATALVMLCVMLGLALLFIAALSIEQWIDNPDRETSIREAPVPARRVSDSLEPVAIDPAMWITQDDYPAESVRSDEQGTVQIRWTIDPSGRVATCDIVSTSGHPRLDEAACGAIRRRGRYNDIRPATYPRQSTRRVVWRLPGD